MILKKYEKYPRFDPMDVNVTSLKRAWLSVISITES